MFSFNLFRKPKPEDAFMDQARKDQKTALYPGYELGSMSCNSQSCGCNETRPSYGFVKARARHLYLRSSLPTLYWYEISNR